MTTVDLGLHGGAVYTMRLHQAIALAPNTEHGDNDIGLYQYPIFDEAHRAVLNQKIIDHYYNDEIGYESIALFRLGMRRRMNEIMPRFNKLYESELLTFNPFHTVDITATSSSESQSHMDNSGTSTDEATSTSSSDTTNQGRTVQSDTPQVPLSGNGDYATAAVDSRNTTGVSGNGSEQRESSNTGTTDGTSSDSSESRTVGYQGVPADLLMAFRDTILNIDLDIINALEDLFMGILDNGSTRYPHRYGVF